MNHVFFVEVVLSAILLPAKSSVTFATLFNNFLIFFTVSGTIVFVCAHWFVPHIFDCFLAYLWLFCWYFVSKLSGKFFSFFQLNILFLVYVLHKFFGEEISSTILTISSISIRIVISKPNTTTWKFKAESLKNISDNGSISSNCQKALFSEIV